MQNHLTYRISLILVLLLFKTNGNAQHNDIVRFENDTIAIKKQNDTIYFYNSVGELRKIVSLNSKKSTPYGLPKEVQDIIYDGEISERIEISEETFPTYLYKQRYVDAGIVLCSVNYFYNDVGLQTGYKEICPNDIADGDDYNFGGENLYKYNKYGLLIETEGVVYKYNDNGQLIEKNNRNSFSKKVYRNIKYKYNENKLLECVIHKNNSNSIYQDTIKLKYVYNTKGLLSEIIKSKRSKIVLEYNEDNKVAKVSEVKTWRDREFKHTYLAYYYDINSRIVRIQIDHQSGYADKDLGFVYDIHGNLIQKILDGKIIASYKYDSKGTLIYLEHNKRWGESKGYLKY